MPRGALFDFRNHYTIRFEAGTCDSAPTILNFDEFRFQYTQVGFAEFNNTADNRANIGGTIIGAPIVGQ